MHYVDTSVLVASLTKEAGSDRVLSWLGGQAEGTLALSRWGLTEMSSALSIKIRTGTLTVIQRDETLASWRAASKDVFLVLPIMDAHFDAAADLTGQERLGLRGGDALHIAIARASGCALVTLDQRMAEAAKSLGVPVTAI